MRPEHSVSVLQREKRIKEFRDLFFQLSADEQMIARSLCRCLFGITKLRSSRLAWPYFGGAPHRSKVCKQALHYRVKLTDTGGWYSSMRVGEDCAAVKVTIDDQSDEILGAHLLSPNGAE
jgi:hypothetical protein